MHIGNLRTALYGYLYAKAQKGDFILRIEDTDRTRYVADAVDFINRTLEMAHIVPDEGPDIGGDCGPYVQSERMDIYKKYAEELVKTGHAYYCFCDKAESEEDSGEFDRGDSEKIEYLTEAEIAAFESLHPMQGTQAAAARDLFVFQLYTGLSYSDAQAFDISDYKEVDGKWINTGTRIKTGVPYVNQLLPPVIEILQRYGWQAPKILNSDYNKCLKILAAAVGIETRLHSHLARHTFATRMLRMGVKIENLSKMLGHTNITQTQKYAKVMAQSVHDDFEMVAKKLMESHKSEKPD